MFSTKDIQGLSFWGVPLLWEVYPLASKNLTRGRVKQCQPSQQLFKLTSHELRPLGSDFRRSGDPPLEHKILSESNPWPCNILLQQAVLLVFAK